MAQSSASLQAGVSPDSKVKPTLYNILFAVSIVHLLNDSMQSVIPAIMPILQNTMNLSYFQLGLLVFVLNLTSSIMQPVVGLYTDAKPSPKLLPFGMVLSCIGMFVLAIAPAYWIVLLGVMMVGLGSAAFHPEGSRVAHMAAGTRRGLAQSIFQVGGNGGQALGPIMTALIFVPLGQFGAMWFTLVAALAVIIQMYIAKWYKEYLILNPRVAKGGTGKAVSAAHRKRILAAVTLLIFIIFARSWYGASISGYYQFYLMEKFSLEVDKVQFFIFGFLLAGAIGTFFGGPLADRFGRKNVLFFSMLGSAPFALLLPYANMFWSYVLLLLIGFIQLSSFSVSVVYAQELVPGKVGLVSGLTTGLAFGMGALGSVVLGGMADAKGIAVVMNAAAYLPLLGLLAVFLPSDRKLRQWTAE